MTSYSVLNVVFSQHLNNVLPNLGSLDRILKAGLVSDNFSLFTGLAFSCRGEPITAVDTSNN